MFMDPQPEPAMIKLFGVFISETDQPNPSSNIDRHPQEKRPKPKLSRLVIKMKNRSEPMPDQLPVEFYVPLRSIGAVLGDHGPKLFFSRKLYASDVDNGLARLTIPRSRIMRSFLTPKEEEILKQIDNNGRLKNRLDVTVIDPKLVVRPLSLSRWNYQKRDRRSQMGDPSWSYALNGGWMDVVRSNGLAQGTDIQLWSFRVNDGSLGLIINVKPEEPGVNHGEYKKTGSSSSDGDQSMDSGTLHWGMKRRRGSTKKFI